MSIIAYFLITFHQGPCCTNDCNFKQGNFKCRDNNGCREESFCDGTFSMCPMSELKPNKTVCNKEFVCYKGVGFTDIVVVFINPYWNLI